MKCKKCGKEVKKTDAFCQYCGTKVETEVKEVKKVEKKEEVKQEVVKKAPVENQGGKGLSIASMVLGIVGIVFSFIIGPFAFILSLLGFIFALCSKRKNGFRLAGLITSIVGIVFQIIETIFIIFFSAVLFSYIGNAIDDYDIDDFLDDDYTYKYATPYGEWTCVPYPEKDYKTKEETTLNLKYGSTFVYGPKGDLDNNYYKGTWSYEKEYDKNAKYTDREFVKITAPVTEFKMNGISQDATNKSLNLEMEFINDYDETIIMFDNTQNTYHCKK